MKTFAFMLAGAALALSGSAAVAKNRTGEERLAQLLEGRTAGQPERCITTFRSNGVQVLDRVGLIYVDGKTVWVARASNPEDLRDDDILIIDHISGSQLCRDDVRRTIDRTSGMLSSVVFLGDFVPYRRS